MKKLQNSKYLIYAILIVLLTGGCASVPTQDTKVYPEPRDDKGLVYFFREGKFAGSAISYKIRSDEKIIGAIKNGSYFFYWAEPGTHTFTAKTEAKVSRTLEIEGGETYYIKCGVEMGVFAGRPSMTIVNEQEGKSLLPELKYAVSPKVEETESAQ